MRRHVPPKKLHKTQAREELFLDRPLGIDFTAVLYTALAALMGVFGWNLVLLCRISSVISNSTRSLAAGSIQACYHT